MYDVIIIGSGVAGSTAAYFLADARAKVLVLEKLQLPRYKTCGGGLIHRSVNLLPFSLDEVIESRFLSIDIFDQENGLHFNVNRSSPLVSMVMRKDLDYFILNKAINKGAEVKDMIQVDDLQYDVDIVKVIAKNEVLKSRFIIGADGAMGITIKSGKLAAESITKGNFNPGTVSKIYTKSTSKILTELKYARMLSFFVYHSSALRSMVFKMYGEKLSGLLTDISMGEKTYSELIKNPSNHLKLLTKAYIKTG